MMNNYKTNLNQKHLLRIVFMIICMIIFAIPVANIEANAKTVYIGQAATADKAGIKGDQSGNEVSISNWSYSTKSSSYNHWTHVIRCTNKSHAKRMAQIVIDACYNDHIGYAKSHSKSDCNEYYTNLKNANWDPKEINKKCDTVCTPFVSCAIRGVGYTDMGDCYHSDTFLVKWAKKRADWEVYTDDSFTAGTTKLKVGDILVGTKSPSHHGCMVVSTNGVKPDNNIFRDQIELPKNKNFVKGKKYQLLYTMNVREGAGTEFEIKDYLDLADALKKYSISKEKAILKRGTVVKCIDTNNEWIKTSSGWICGYSDNEYNIAVYKETDIQKNFLELAIVDKSLCEEKSKTSYKVGKEYKLAKALYIRKGPGKKYSIKYKSNITSDAKKHTVKGIKKAKLKRNTVVTCLKIKGNWMKIPSGWICCKKGNIKSIK